MNWLFKLFRQSIVNSKTPLQDNQRVSRRRKVAPKTIAPDVRRSGSTLRSQEWTVLVLDESGSMLDDDYPPSRLYAAQKAARLYMEIKAKRAPQDCVGIVGFDCTGKTLLPPIPVKKALKRWPAVARQLGRGGGTCLKNGLATANRAFRGRSQNPKVRRRIILLNDGHGGDPRGYANKLKSQGYEIDTIGIGRTRHDVNERILKGIASKDEHGP